MKILNCIAGISIMAGTLHAGDSLEVMTRERSAEVTLQVSDRVTSLQSVLERTQQQGGYFLAWDEWNVTVRVPIEHFDAFLAGLDSVGHKAEQSYTTEEHGDELANLESSLASRRKLLDSYFAMVESSPVSNMQVIERATIDLADQIERDEGRRRGILSRIQSGLVKISFHYQDRTLPAPDGSSPFAWINGIDLTLHREAFQ